MADFGTKKKTDPTIWLKLQSHTSNSLIQRLKADEPTAWTAFLRLYERLIRYWCKQSGVPSTDLDDIVQEVTGAIFKSIVNFEKSEPSHSLRAWMWTITRNKVANYFRKKSQNEIAKGGTTANLFIAQLPENEPPESDSVFIAPDSPVSIALTTVQQTVKDETFRAFWRTTIDGVPVDIVAKELKISTDSIYQAKSRVLKRIRDQLESELNANIESKLPE